jgi:hypothetical protein
MKWSGLQNLVELELSEIKEYTEDKEGSIAKIAEDYKALYMYVVSLADEKREKLNGEPKKEREVSEGENRNFHGFRELVRIDIEDTREVTEVDQIVQNYKEIFENVIIQADIRRKKLGIMVEKEKALSS